MRVFATIQAKCCGGMNDILRLETKISVLDGVMLLWFVLTAAALIFVATGVTPQWMPRQQ